MFPTSFSFDNFSPLNGEQNVECDSFDLMELDARLDFANPEDLMTLNHDQRWRLSDPTLAEASILESEGLFGLAQKIWHEKKLSLLIDIWEGASQYLGFYFDKISDEVLVEILELLFRRPQEEFFKNLLRNFSFQQVNRFLDVAFQLKDLRFLSLAYHSIPDQCLWDHVPKLVEWLKLNEVEDEQISFYFEDKLRPYIDMEMGVSDFLKKESFSPLTSWFLHGKKTKEEVLKERAERFFRFTETLPKEFTPTARQFSHIHAEFEITATGLEGNRFFLAIDFMTNYLNLIQNERGIFLDAGKFDLLLSDFEGLRSLACRLERLTPLESLEDLNPVVDEILLQLTNKGRAVVPGGWIDDKEGHALIYTIERQSDGNYSITVFNTGEGINYHDTRFRNGKQRYSSTFKVINVRPEFLENGVILNRLLAFRVVEASKVEQKFNAKDIYMILFNIAEGQVEESEESTNWVLPQYSGNCSWKVLVAYLGSLVTSVERKRFIHYVKIYSAALYYQDYIQNNFKQDKPTQFLLLEKSFKSLAKTAHDLYSKRLINFEEYLESQTIQQYLRKNIKQTDFTFPLVDEKEQRKYGLFKLAGLFFFNGISTVKSSDSEIFLSSTELFLESVESLLKQFQELITCIKKLPSIKQDYTFSEALKVMPSLERLATLIKNATDNQLDELFDGVDLFIQALLLAGYHKSTPGTIDRFFLHAISGQIVKEKMSRQIGVEKLAKISFLSQVFLKIFIDLRPVTENLIYEQRFAELASLFFREKDLFNFIQVEVNKNGEILEFTPVTCLDTDCKEWLLLIEAYTSATKITFCEYVEAYEKQQILPEMFYRFQGQVLKLFHGAKQFSPDNSLGKNNSTKRVKFIYVDSERRRLRSKLSDFIALEKSQLAFDIMKKYRSLFINRLNEFESVISLEALKFPAALNFFEEASMVAFLQKDIQDVFLKLLFTPSCIAILERDLPSQREVLYQSSFTYEMCEAASKDIYEKFGRFLKELRDIAKRNGSMTLMVYIAKLESLSNARLAEASYQFNPFEIVSVEDLLELISQQRILNCFEAVSAILKLVNLNSPLDKRIFKLMQRLCFVELRTDQEVACSEAVCAFLKRHITNMTDFFHQLDDRELSEWFDAILSDHEIELSPIQDIPWTGRFPLFRKGSYSLDFEKQIVKKNEAPLFVLSDQIKEYLKKIVSLNPITLTDFTLNQSEISSISQGIIIKVFSNQRISVIITSNRISEILRQKLKQELNLSFGRQSFIYCEKKNDKQSGNQEDICHIDLRAYGVPEILEASFFERWASLNSDEYIFIHKSQPVAIHLLIHADGSLTIKDFKSGGQLIKQANEPHHIRAHLRPFDPQLLCWRCEEEFLVDSLSYKLTFRVPLNNRKIICDQFPGMVVNSGPSALLANYPGAVFLENQEMQILLLNKESYTRRDQKKFPLNPFLILATPSDLSIKDYYVLSRSRSVDCCDPLQGFEGQIDDLFELIYALALLEDYEHAIHYVLKVSSRYDFQDLNSIKFARFSDLKLQVHGPDLYGFLIHIFLLIFNRTDVKEKFIFACEGYLRFYHRISPRLRLNLIMERELLDRVQNQFKPQFQNLFNSHACVVDIALIKEGSNSFSIIPSKKYEISFYRNDQSFDSRENYIKNHLRETFDFNRNRALYEAWKFRKLNLTSPIDRLKPIVKLEQGFLAFFYEICLASYHKDSQKLMLLFMQIGHLYVTNSGREFIEKLLLTSLLEFVENLLSHPQKSLVSEKEYQVLLDSDEFAITECLVAIFNSKYASYFKKDLGNLSTKEEENYFQIITKETAPSMSPRPCFFKALNAVEAIEQPISEIDFFDEPMTVDLEKRVRKRKRQKLLPVAENIYESLDSIERKSRIRPRPSIFTLSDDQDKSLYEQFGLRKIFDNLSLSGKLNESSRQLVLRLEDEFSHFSRLKTDIILPDLEELKVEAMASYELADQTIHHLLNQLTSLLEPSPEKISSFHPSIHEAWAHYFDINNEIIDRVTLKDAFIWFFTCNVHDLTLRQNVVYKTIQHLLSQILISRINKSIVKQLGDMKNTSQRQGPISQELRFLIEALEDIRHAFVLHKVDKLKLFFQVMTNKILRPRQVRAAELLKKHSSLVMQIPCGEGKTKVLSCMIALSALRERRLVLNIVPGDNFQSNRSDLANQAHFLGIFRVLPLEFSRNDERDFKVLYEFIEKAKCSGDILIAKPQTIQSFLLSYIDLLRKICSNTQVTQDDVDDLYFLTKILNIFMYQSTAIMDEIHTVLDPLHLLNYSLSTKRLLPSYRRETVEMLFQEMLCLNAKKTEAFFPIEGSKNAEWNLDTYHSSQRNALAEALTLRLIKDFKDIPTINTKKIFDYLTFIVGSSEKERQALEGWLVLLPEELNKRLKLLRAQLHHYLPHCFKLRCHVDYGPSDNSLKAIPYEHNMVPSYDTEFEHYDTLLNLTYSMYFALGLSKQMLISLLEHLQNTYAKNSDLSSFLSMGRDPSQTKETFDKIDRLGVYQADLSNPSVVDTLFESLSKDPTLIFYYLKNFVFKQMDVQMEKLSSNAQQIGACLFEQVIAFSGTPSNYFTYPVNLPCIFDEGEDAKVVMRLMDQETVRILETKDVDFRELLANGYSMFIDPHAYLEGINTKTVANDIVRSAPESVKYVLYFDLKKNIPMLLGRDGSEVAYDENRVSPLERVTFYDEQHYSGVDILQPETARGCLLVNFGLTLTELIQASMRLRKLGLGQKLDLVIPANVRAEITNLFMNEMITNEQVIAWALHNEGQSLEIVLLPSLLHQVQNVFKRRLLRNLLEVKDSIKVFNPTQKVRKFYLKHQELLVEAVDHEDFIELASLALPKSPLKRFQEYFSSLLEKHGSLLTAADKEELEKVRVQASKLLSERVARELTTRFKATYEQEFELEAEIFNKVPKGKKLSSFNPEDLGKAEFVKGFIETGLLPDEVAIGNESKNAQASKHIDDMIAKAVSSPFNQRLTYFDVKEQAQKHQGITVRRLNKALDKEIFSPTIYISSNLQIISEACFSNSRRIKLHYIADKINYMLRIVPVKYPLAERVVLLHDKDADAIRKWLVHIAKKRDALKATYQLFDFKMTCLANSKGKTVAPHEKNFFLRNFVQVLFINGQSHYKGDELSAIKEWLAIDFITKKQFFLFQRKMRATSVKGIPFNEGVLDEIFQNR